MVIVSSFLINEQEQRLWHEGEIRAAEATGGQTEEEPKWKMKRDDLRGPIIEQDL